MEISLRAGCMAVFAVSGSVVLLSLKAHKHLMSDFMNKIEFEFVGIVKGENEKKVRFLEEAEVLPSIGHDDHYPEKEKKKQASPSTNLRRGVVDDEKRFKSMPENWQALYRGIIQFRSLKRHNV
ncbi:unnamed protein product [Cuscuta epithymum]|uniref:Uncharacterized protein n=1 Tax=Cuscuta epithymum TaxID=186058 RepID=A0AAV0FIC4_9ASTE|nr:unnamed protein product [Cuscuta epithymum]